MPPTRVSRRKATEGGPECDNCHKTFSRRDDVRRHKLAVHDEIKNFFCEVEGCEKGFSLLSALKTHRKTHSNERPHYCVLCGKDYKSERTWKRHVKEVHEHDGSEFMCPLCSTRYRHQRQFVEHLKKHDTILEKSVLDQYRIPPVSLAVLTVEPSSSSSGAEELTTMDCTSGFANVYVLANSPTAEAEAQQTALEEQYTLAFAPSGSHCSFPHTEDKNEESCYPELTSPRSQYTSGSSIGEPTLYPQGDLDFSLQTGYGLSLDSTLSGFEDVRPYDSFTTFMPPSVSADVGYDVVEPDGDVENRDYGSSSIPLPSSGDYVGTYYEGVGEGSSCLAPPTSYHRGSTSAYSAFKQSVHPYHDTASLSQYPGNLVGHRSTYHDCIPAARTVRTYGSGFTSFPQMVNLSAYDDALFDVSYRNSMDCLAGGFSAAAGYRVPIPSQVPGVPWVPQLLSSPVDTNSESLSSSASTSPILPGYFDLGNMSPSETAGICHGYMNALSLEGIPKAP